MATTLTLTDGTTTIQLNNGSPWSIESDGIGFLWKPAINPWLPNDLAGGGDYGPATEEIPIVGNASTQTSLRQSLQTLLAATQRVASAYDGDVIESRIWRIQWTPEGSAQAYESVLTDCAINVIDHPETATGGALTRVTVRATRRDRWMAGIPTTGSSSILRRTGTITTGTITTPSAFTGATGVHPGYLELARETNASNVQTRAGAGGYIIIVAEADSGNRTSLQHWPFGGSPGGAWSNVAAETGNYRSQILRYTPAGTAWTTVNVDLDTPNFILNKFRTRTIDAYMLARNNSATTTFFTRLRYITRYSSLTSTVTPVATIQPYSGSAAPVLVYCGRVILEETPDYDGTLVTMNLSLEVSASAASGTIDFDDIVLINPDAEGTNIIRLNPDSIAILRSSPPPYRAGLWEHRAIRNKRVEIPGMYASGSSTAQFTDWQPNSPWQYYGQAGLLLPTAPTILLYGGIAAGTGTEWSRYLASTDYRIMRRLAYQVPE